MMIHRSFNHHQNNHMLKFSFGFRAITNVLYKHSITVSRGKTGAIKSRVKSPTKANTGHYHGVFK